MRVGGDFMFARLLIPVTPFCALALEAALEVVATQLLAVGRRATIPAMLGACAIAIVAFSPPSSGATGVAQGILDEREYHEHMDREGAIRRGEELRELTRGLDVRAAIIGTQAVVAYYSQIPTVIEASTGLTDAFVAHQRLAKRGRVGHEKAAPLAYLIERRRATFHVGWSPELADSLRSYIPVVRLRYKTVHLTLLTWDPAVMTELWRPGAQCKDATATLDRLIAEMPCFPDSTVARAYGRWKRFYFDGMRDTARQAPFVRRLKGAS